MLDVDTFEQEIPQLRTHQLRNLMRQILKEYKSRGEKTPLCEKCNSALKLFVILP